ncbi:MAG: NAD(P)-binding domain-containing protein [Pseudomonas sp.]
MLYDQMVKSDGSGGHATSKAFSFAAPVGVDIGKAMIYGDGVGSLANAGGITLDTLTFKQIHHDPGYIDTFANEVGQKGTFHSADGHYTLTSKGSVVVQQNADMLSIPHLYIGKDYGAMTSSSAILTFDQPVKYFSYDMMLVENLSGNGSWLEVYDTNGNKIFNRLCTNSANSKTSWEQFSYEAPAGISIGKVVIYSDGAGMAVTNFTSILASDVPTGQMLIDHSWETYYDEQSVSQALVQYGQSFAGGGFQGGSSMAGYHSTAGGFTVTGAGSVTQSAAQAMWVNGQQGAMKVLDSKTATLTFDSLRSEVDVSVTGIEKGNTAILKVYGAGGTLLDTINMTNPTGTYDIQSFTYKAAGNVIHHIEITGEGGGTYVTGISSAVTQVAVKDDVVSMVVDPVAYFAQDSAHIFGSSGLDTLKLTGANQVLDLTRLTGDSDAAKISSIEKFDITGTGNNTLKISLNDVLHLGETDMFRKDGKVQVMVDGDAGDKVQLANLHDHGTAPGSWQSAGTTTIGGATYQVYSYSNLDAEVLIKQAVSASIV